MKLVIIISTLFWLTLLWSPSTSQSTFTVIGSVRDQAGHNVSGVRLSVVDENFQPIRTIFIDATGRFTIKGLGQGKFTFRIETTGTNFEEQSQLLELQSIRRLGGNETFPIDFILKFKKSASSATSSGAVFAQEAPKAAQKEFERGVNNLKASKTNQAIASLKKAIEIFPDYYDALETLGVEYVKSAQYAAALPVLSHALEVNKRGFKSMYGLGVANLKLNQLQVAIDWLEKSAQLEPSSANTQMMLGLAYGAAGSLDKSEEAFRKSLQLGGQAAAEARFYLAALYNKQGKYSDARQELEGFLKESKNLKDPAQIKAMIENLKEKERTKPSQNQGVATAPDGVNQRSVADQSATADAGSGVASLEAAKEPTPVAAAREPRVPTAVAPLTPEMTELLRQSQVNGGKMSRKLLDFTYQLKKTRRILNQRGQPTATQEQVFEAYPIKGEHVLIMLSRDGIQSKTVVDERKRAAKELEEAEQKRVKEQESKPDAESTGGLGDYLSAGVFGISAGNPAYVTISASAFLRYCEFFSPRAEKLGDREAVVFSFRPRFGAELSRNYSYINKLVGTIWIDQEDKIIARLEGWPDAEGAFDFAQSTAPHDKATLIYQQERLADRLWFPKLIRMNAEGRPEIFDGLNWDVVFEFSKYQQFNTTSSEQIESAGSKKP